MSDKIVTGYPSIDKPWLKYYSEEAINAPLPECSIYEYLWDHNKDHLDSTAIRYYGNTITYDGLFRRIKNVASAFHACGVRKGDVVAVCLPTIPEAVFAVYALNYLGATPNMLDPRYNEKLLEYCLQEAPTKLLLTFDGCYRKFLNIGASSLPERIVVVPAVNSASTAVKAISILSGKRAKPARERDMMWKEFLRASSDEKSIPHVENERGKCAFILHTGGTTGNPKGVMLTNDSVNSIAHQYAMTGYGNHERGWTVLDIIPPFASYGLCVSVHMPLASGVALIMIPKFAPEAFGDLVAKYKPSYVAAVPSFLEGMIKNPKLQHADLSYMVSLGCGGDSMTIEQENRINRFMEEHNSKARVDKGYGMSEVSATACANAGAIRKVGSIGAPFANTTIKIVDPATYDECPYNVSGEICITGPGMMLGYIRNEELTAKTIKAHKDGLRWVHTGDLGHITEDGFLFHDGRIKRMIVRFDGFKIYPEAVEQAISRYPQVHQCAVVRAKDEKVGVIAKAFIVLKDGSKGGVDIWGEIKKYCVQDLAERSIPQAYEFVPTLPLTSIGKIDYRALEKEAEESHHD